MAESTVFFALPSIISPFEKIICSKYSMLIFENSSNSLRKDLHRVGFECVSRWHWQFQCPCCYATQPDGSRPTRCKLFLMNYGNLKNHHIEYPPQIEEVHCKIHINLVKYNLLTVQFIGKLVNYIENKEEKTHWTKRKF